MASNTTLETPTYSNSHAELKMNETEGRDAGSSLPSKNRKLLSLTPSEAAGSGSLPATRQSALARYAGSFKLRFLGDASTRKGRKGATESVSYTNAEDIDNHQKQTESSSLKSTEDIPGSVTFAETERSAPLPLGEKTSCGANVVIPAALKGTSTNDSTESNGVVQHPEDQAVVNEVALGAGVNEGGDGREDDNAVVAPGAGGDGGDDGREDDNAVVVPGAGGDGGDDGREDDNAVVVPGAGGDGGDDGREDDNAVVVPGAGGDGGGRGGGSGGGDYGDSDSKIHPLTTEPPKEKEEEFRFFLLEEEPVLHRDFQQRAKKAVQAAVLDAVDEQKQSASGECFQRCNACCEYDPFKSPKPSKFTPELKVASTQGLKMMKKLFSPALPRVLRDLWVYVEIAVTFYQFILAVVTLSLENNQAFNITYLVLSSINAALALLDGFIYFIQLGSCVQCFRYCYSKYRRGKVANAEKEEEEEEEEESSKKRSWWKMSPKRQHQVGEWLELVRSIATELLLYPLLICDLFDFIVGGSLRRETSADQINFSLFVVGGFYLVVSVYFIRMFMVTGSVINLLRIPINASKSRKSYLRLIVWFAVHVLTQVFASAVIIVTVAVKINDENSVERCPSINGTMPICASPFLIYDAVVGGIIPLFGVASFFIINAYQMRQLSAGLWIDMISLLQSESFADLVFQGKGVKVAKTKAKNFVQQIELHDVKKQYKAWRSSPVWASIVYPFKIPIIAALGIVYELLLASFLTTIFLGQDIDDLGTAALVWYLVAVAVLVMANLPLILFATLWLLMALAMLLLVILFPVYILLYALLYVPVGAFFGCLFYCSSLYSELGVFQRPVRVLTRLRETVRGHTLKPNQEVKNIEKEGTSLQSNTVAAAASEPVSSHIDLEPIKLAEPLQIDLEPMKLTEPSHIDLAPVKLTELHDVDIGDLITIEFQNA